MTVPVWPPAAACVRRRTAGRRQNQNQRRDDDDRRAPKYEAPLPAAADQRKHQRQHQRHGKNFTDQEAVGIDGGGKADALRNPAAHRRRHGHLHDGDAGAHGHRHRIEPHHVGDGAAQRAADRGDGEPDHQRRAHAEPRDQQRAGHGGDREQHRGQAGENADLGGVEPEPIVNQRNDRRHRQDGEPQGDACEPQLQQRADKAGLRPRLAGILHGRSRHCGWDANVLILRLAG